MATNMIFFLLALAMDSEATVKSFRIFMSFSTYDREIFKVILVKSKD